MKHIVIGFSRPKKWHIFSSLIMWWDKSDVSHGYFRFHSVSWGQDFIYQASHSRTNFMGGDYFDSLNVTVEEFFIPVDDGTEAKVGALCVKREGKPYAIKQAIGIILVNITYLISFGKIKIKKNPFANGDAETVCIEEVAEILKETLGLSSGLDTDMISVKPFREWVRSIAVKS